VIFFPLHDTPGGKPYQKYNFCRAHQTLRITPAMEAGISDHIWSIKEIVDLLDRQTSAAA
jgi:hypothetical protein